MNDDFPIRDYDHLTTGDLQHRIRSLSADELRRVLEHERAHGDRTPVVELLTARLSQVEDGAEPAGGDQRNTPPADSAGGKPEVSPAHSPDPNTPLRHGVAGQTPSRGRP
ncbi:hypothetical protein FHS29_005222 [Saccharothrix tamanrassetensis]|uniref:DUF8129 domain-containing protein n=1 Tax=Saccharothrix tamanrassetensis TaxID=1051531 RepID=A0A841CQI1_9PSEU|nr:hypothetical protein [Saccharothrix tamanrassetensis]MBB5958614.1 hypothetical protein [Saccharothrix tamanrassetensis]